MATRKLIVLAFVLVGGLAVALSPRRRALAAQAWARARRFLAQRFTDHDAEERLSIDRWDNEGGAPEPSSDAAGS